MVKDKTKDLFRKCKDENLFTVNIPFIAQVMKGVNLREVQIIYLCILHSRRHDFF